MLTAKHPDEPGPAVAAALKQHRVPVRLRAICLKAMSASRDDRYPDAGTLADDVSRFRAGLAVSAHRETVVERLARFVSAYRVPILLVLAYLVMRALVALYVSRRP
jgi:hypothetical protein